MTPRSDWGRFLRKLAEGLDGYPGDYRIEQPGSDAQGGQEGNKACARSLSLLDRIFHERGSSSERSPVTLRTGLSVIRGVTG
jgi:hypothetical protein